jgi:Glycosyltransferase family 92
MTITMCNGRNVHTSFRYIMAVDIDELIVPLNVSSRYIMAVDIDELIVPLNSTANLPQMMNNLETMFSSKLPSTFVFWNSFHFLDDSPDVGVSPNLTILRFRRKAPLSDYGNDVKSIVNPRSCVSMHNQYCWTPTPAIATKDGQTYLQFVSPSVALKQAYR